MSSTVKKRGFGMDTLINSGGKAKSQKASESLPMEKEVAAIGKEAPKGNTHNIEEQRKKELVGPMSVYADADLILLMEEMKWFKAVVVDKTTVGLTKREILKEALIALGEKIKIKELRERYADIMPDFLSLAIEAKTKKKSVPSNKQ